MVLVGSGQLDVDIFCIFARPGLDTSKHPPPTPPLTKGGGKKTEWLLLGEAGRVGQR